MLAVFAVLLLVALSRLPETIRARSGDATQARVIAARVCAAFRASPVAQLPVALDRRDVDHAPDPRFSAGIYEREFGVTGLAFAAFFASHGLGIIVGQIANRRLIAAFGTAKAMLAGSLVWSSRRRRCSSLLASGMATAWILTAILMLFATSYLIVFSNAAAMVLDPHGDIAGFAAAIYGSTSQIGSALIVSVLVTLIGTSARSSPRHFSALHRRQHRYRGLGAPRLSELHRVHREKFVGGDRLLLLVRHHHVPSYLAVAIVARSLLPGCQLHLQSVPGFTGLRKRSVSRP